MVASEKPGQLSRRLLSNYMMFGLLSIVTLAASILVIVKASQAPSSGPGLLTRLAEAAERLTRDAAENHGDGLQSIIEGLAQDSELQFCGVVDSDGFYCAHSDPVLKGRKGVISISPDTIPGLVECVSYLREDQRGPKDYWLPLRQDEKVFGVLQARVQHNESNPLMNLVHQHFGTAMMIPVLLLLLGGIRLRGVVRTSSTIDQQLAHPVLDGHGELLVHTVEESSPAAAGWNRLVMQLEKGHVLKNMESRLNDVLGGVRTKQHEQILQHMSEGIAVTDAAGVVTFANRAFALLLDSGEHSLCGQPLSVFIPQNIPENIRKFTIQCQELSRPAVIELNRSQDLSDGVLRLARQPFRADDSDTTFQLWSLRDISQQKLIEHTRDQFVDTATHELRTPLSNIKACAETLAMGDPLDEEVQKMYLNSISSEAARLSRFVDEFLNISRMEAGSISLNRHATNLERLVRDALENSRAQFDQKQLEVNLQLPAKLPEISLDKDKISAALVNLLGNAGKYTPDGGKVSVNVEIGKSDVRIHVSDSGFGIASDEHGKVFNKFFRSDDQRVRDISGTGLGLSFAQEVLRLHGGNISVRSELNKGSRFTMTLPLA